MSLVGEKRDPYRPICDGWPAPIFKTRSCFSHFRKAESTLTKLTNVTKVTDYAGGDPIPPYPRPNDAPGDIPECASLPDCSEGQPLCGPWPDDEKPGGGSGVACAEGDPEVGDNCFHSGGTLNLAMCRKLGFKNVQARKSWHGRYGFLHMDLVTEPIQNLPTGTLSGGDCSCSSDFEAERTTVDHNKYRTLEITEEYDVTGGDDRISSRTVTVGRLTGRKVLTASSDTNNPAVPGGLGDTTYAPPEPFNIQSAISMFYEAVTLGTISYSPAVFAFTPPTSADITGTPGEFSFSLDQRDGDGNGVTVTVELSVSGGYFHSTGEEYDFVTGMGNGTHTRHFEKNLDLTNTTSNFLVTDQKFQPVGSAYGPNVYTLDATLSDLYTGYDRAAEGDDCYQDACTLLDEFPLNDDKIYPWRTDNFVSIAPLVTYDESIIAVAPIPVPAQMDNDDSGLDTWNEEGYTAGVANPPAYSGAILGSPLTEGHDKFFSWIHRTWRCCTVDEVAAYYPYSYGAFNVDGSADSGDFTDDVIPGCATQWTENNGSFGGQLGYYGAWLWFMQDFGVLWAQKWAEIKNPRPSYNFFGPCGEARFRFSERFVGCVDTYDSDTKVVTLIHPVTGLTSGTGLICGVDPAVDGVWAFTRTDDSHYTLTGSRLRTAPDRTDCDNPTFGKLRFPDAWSICGRVAVTSSSEAGGTVTVNCGSVPYLRTGDAVDFTDADGGVTESNKTVTVISETQFTFSGTIPTGTYVKSHDAPDYWFYDNRPKGSYLKAEWAHNYRDYQERERVVAQDTDCGCDASDPADSTLIRQYQEGHGMAQSVADFDVTRHCLAWTPCWPQVMCLSPNGEVWDNGETHDFPATFELDSRYGLLWQGVFIQQVTDYDFQATTDPDTDGVDSGPWDSPHKPCDLVYDDDHDDPTTWNEDNGHCQEDVHPDYYYPLPRFVEPEIELPTVNSVEAPALPSGCFLGFLSLDDLDTASAVSGNVLPPPEPVGVGDCPNAEPLEVETPWAIYIAQQDCVCEQDPSGRFADEYADDLVLC